MGKNNFRSHHAAIGLGVGVALVTVISGIASWINGWHDDSDITREVFENVPGALKVAFYTVIPALIIYGAILFANRIEKLGKRNS